MRHMHWLHAFSHGVAFHEGSHVLSASSRATARDNASRFKCHLLMLKIRIGGSGLPRCLSFNIFQLYFPNPISHGSVKIPICPSFTPLKTPPQKSLIHLFRVIPCDSMRHLWYAYAHFPSTFFRISSAPRSTLVDLELFRGRLFDVEASPWTPEFCGGT